MSNYVRLESNERVDLVDLTRGTYEDHVAEQRRHVDKFLAPVTPPAGTTRQWILDGFEPTFDPGMGGGTLDMNIGRAILAARDGASVVEGHLVSEGTASRSVDISSFADATYQVYIRFRFIEGSSENRLFWDPSSAAEYAKAINTRQLADWDLSVETSSPGAEWLNVGEITTVAGSITALTDKRPLYFEGAVDNSYAQYWGGGTDRNADRQQYGVKDLYTQLDAFRQCIAELKDDTWYAASSRYTYTTECSFPSVIGDGTGLQVKSGAGGDLTLQSAASNVVVQGVLSQIAGTDVEIGHVGGTPVSASVSIKSATNGIAIDPVSGQDLTLTVAGGGAVVVSGGDIEASSLTAGASPLSLGGTAIQGPDGAVGLVGFGFTNDPDTGMYLAGVGDLSFAVAGSQELRLTGGHVVASGTIPSLWLGSDGTVDLTRPSGTDDLDITVDGTITIRFNDVAGTDDLVIENDTTVWATFDSSASEVAWEVGHDIEVADTVTHLTFDNSNQSTSGGTQNLEFVGGALLTGGTDDGWISIEINGTQRYIRVHSTK